MGEDLTPFFPEEESSLPGMKLPLRMRIPFEQLNVLRDKIITDYTRCIFINAAVMPVTFKNRFLSENKENGSQAMIAGK